MTLCYRFARCYLWGKPGEGYTGPALFLTTACDCPIISIQRVSKDSDDGKVASCPKRLCGTGLSLGQGDGHRGPVIFPQKQRGEAMGGGRQAEGPRSPSLSLQESPASWDAGSPHQDSLFLLPSPSQ